MEKAKLYGMTKVYDHFVKSFGESIDVLRKQKHGRHTISKINTIKDGKKASSSSSSVASRSQVSQSSF
jgi:hypothetical protein